MKKNGSTRVQAPINSTSVIYKLIVHPDYQNRSVGRKLMLKLENLFDSGTRFELWTGRKNEKNISLYEKLGSKKIVKQLLRLSLH
jgi:ribosomal protein S18 acetylase RimI-like enzyme